MHAYIHTYIPCMQTLHTLHYVTLPYITYKDTDTYTPTHTPRHRHIHIQIIHMYYIVYRRCD